MIQIELAASTMRPSTSLSGGEVVMHRLLSLMPMRATGCLTFFELELVVIIRSTVSLNATPSRSTGCSNVHRGFEIPPSLG